MIVSDICNSCVCLPVCICKENKKLIFDCSIIRDDLKDKSRTLIHLEKTYPILFYGLNRKIFIEIHDSYVFILKEHKGLSWICIDKIDDLI
jgi:hypothetical protein